MLEDFEFQVLNLTQRSQYCEIRILETCIQCELHDLPGRLWLNRGHPRRRVYRPTPLAPPRLLLALKRNRVNTNKHAITPHGGLSGVWRCSARRSGTCVTGDRARLQIKDTFTVPLSGYWTTNATRLLELREDRTPQGLPAAAARLCVLLYPGVVKNVCHRCRMDMQQDQIL